MTWIVVTIITMIINMMMIAIHQILAVTQGKLAAAYGRLNAKKDLDLANTDLFQLEKFKDRQN